MLRIPVDQAVSIPLGRGFWEGQVCLKGSQSIPRGGIPENGGVVRGSGEDLPSVRTEGDSFDTVGVSLKGSQSIPRGGIPENGRMVPGSCEHVPTIWAEGNRRNDGRMPFLQHKLWNFDGRIEMGQSYSPPTLEQQRVVARLARRIADGEPVLVDRVWREPLKGEFSLRVVIVAVDIDRRAVRQRQFNDARVFRDKLVGRWAVV